MQFLEGNKADIGCTSRDAAMHRILTTASLFLALGCHPEVFMLILDKVFDT